MAESGRSNTVMAFIIGGLVVAVGVVAYFMFGEGVPTKGGGSTNITVETSDSGTAGDSGGGTSTGGGASGEASSGSGSGGQSGN